MSMRKFKRKVVGKKVVVKVEEKVKEDKGEEGEESNENGENPATSK